jgi:hypothetical protein
MIRRHTPCKPRHAPTPWAGSGQHDCPRLPLLSRKRGNRLNRRSGGVVAELEFDQQFVAQLLNRSGKRSKGGAGGVANNPPESARGLDVSDR